MQHGSILAVAGLATLVRFGAVVVLDIPPESDYKAYLYMATALYEGRGLVDPFGNLAFYNAGYPLFLFCVFSLAGPSVLAAQMANVLLGALSAVLVFLVGSRVGRSQTVGWISSIMWIGYAEAAVYTEYLAKENLSIPLMLSILYFTLLLPETRKAVLWGAGIGALYAALAITASAALSLFPITVWQISRLQRGLRERLVLLIVLFMSTGLALSPWLYRNQIRLGAPVLNTNGGFNLYLGNNPAATGYFVSIAETPLASEWHRLRKEQGEVAASRCARDAALAHMSEHPLETVRLALIKGLAFWKPPNPQMGSETASFKERAARTVWFVQYVLVCTLMLVTLVNRARATPETLLLWGGVIGYTAVHMLFYVIYRYRLGIMPVVIVLAAYGLWTLITVIRSKTATSPSTIVRG